LSRGREETRTAAKQIATAPRISFTVMVAVLVEMAGMARMAEIAGTMGMIGAAEMMEAAGTMEVAGAEEAETERVVVVLAKSISRLSC
jgi:hypothetical protein